MMVYIHGPSLIIFVGTVCPLSTVQPTDSMVTSIVLDTPVILVLTNIPGYIPWYILHAISHGN